MIELLKTIEVSMSSASLYTIEEGRIYSTQERRAAETEAYEALNFATNLIRKNGELEMPPRSSGSLSIPLGTSNDHLLLTSWYLWTLPSRSQPISGGGNCGNCGDSNGEGVIIVLLVAAVASLIVGTITTLFFTAKQSLKAHKVSKKIEEIQNKGSALKCQAVYTALQPILRAQRKDLISQAALCALLSAGLVVLIASTSVALHAVIQKEPLLLSSLAKPLAIGGGSIAGAALMGHALRPLVKFGFKQRRKAQYENLESKTKDLQQEVPNPVRILQECGNEKAYLKIDNLFFLKNGDHIEMIRGLLPSLEGYTCILGG